MKTANIAELRDHLSSFLTVVERGGEIEVCKHNRPFAHIVPVGKPRHNRTKLGCAEGTCRILGDLTEPLIPESDWEMLK